MHTRIFTLADALVDAILAQTYIVSKADAVPQPAFKTESAQFCSYPFAGHAIHLSVVLMLRVRPLTRFWAFLNWRDCALLKMLA